MARLGLLGQCCNSQYVCCCQCQACRLCCSVCPPIKESTSTRLMYILVLLLGALFMCIMLSPQIEKEIQNTFPHYNRTCVKVYAGQNCSMAFGYMAVYRVAFAMAVFFAVMAILMFGVRNSRGPRAGLHNGLWGMKLLLLCAACVAIFMVPPDMISKISMVWMYVGMAGAFLFIIIQLMLIVDFAHAWTDNWLQKFDNSGNKCWFVAMALCSMIIFVGVAVGVVLLLRSFTAIEGCETNKILIGVNAGLCVLCSFISILSCFRRNTGGTTAGILQSSVISAYVIYLTWSGLASEPRAGEVTSNSAGFIPAPLENCGPSTATFLTDEDIVSYVGVVIMFFMVISSTVQTSHYSYKLGIGVSQPKSLWCCCRPSTEHESEEVQDLGGQHVVRNEGRQVLYSYSFFHVMCCLASLYIMMQLTHWFSPQGAILKSFERSWDSVWVKMASSWACLLIYFLTLVAPELCPGRLNRSRHAQERYPMARRGGGQHSDSE